jgi:hypothetical protein
MIARSRDCTELDFLRVYKTLEDAEKRLIADREILGKGVLENIFLCSQAILASMRTVLQSIELWRNSPDHSEQRLTSQAVIGDARVSEALRHFDTIAHAMGSLTGRQGLTSSQLLGYLLQDLHGEHVVVQHHATRASDDTVSMLDL